MKLYHQYDVHENVENKSVIFYLVENLSYNHMSNAYIEIGVEVKKFDGTSFTDADEIRLVNRAFAFFSGW